MSAFHVKPSASVQGRITVPGDKSISHRSLMLGGIAHGITEVRGFLPSADCHATMQAQRAMGVTIEELGADHLRVRGVGPRGLHAAPGLLDMGNAGTAIRLFMGLLAGQGFGSTLSGDASLQRRPMERVAAPLRLMGADIRTSSGGRPPVELRPVARLQGIDYALPVASAQVKSAVLLAALYAEGVTRVTEPAATRDHTERMFEALGVDLSREGSTVALRGGQALRAAPIDVPGDFSSAAFFIVAGCIAASGSFVIENVGVNPTRTGLLDILRLMGADIRVHARGHGTEPVADLEIHAAPLRGIRVPEELVPLSIDEFPVLFIAAACAAGTTVVTGAGELRVKESDRLAVMAEGLAALGIACELAADGITIEGGRFQGGRVDSHGDHRIAMAFAIASLNAAGPIDIADVENVATSFPGFVQVAHRAGLEVATA